MSAPSAQFPKICEVTDKIITSIGSVICWLNAILIVDIIITVTLRYGFGIGSVALEESQWHLYAICIMFAISYNVVTDSHVRLDVLYRGFPTRTKNIINFLGYLLLLLPFIIVLFMHGLDFVASSLRVHEASESPLGLPYRWAIKSVLPASMFFFGLATISQLIKLTVTLFGKNPAREA